MADTHAAHDLSEAALGGPIRIRDGHFVDSYDRILSLRGLNIAGASKLPTEPNGLSHLTEGFYEHRTVTFVGRPFPLEEAPLHFSRLQAWGLPFVRLLVTWESIGHAGPDPNTELDLEYMDYLRELVKLMPRYGIKCFVCAHQDVWSRFSGGSGAPGWTFEVAGLNVEAFTDTGAAYVHGQDELRRAEGLTNPNEPGGPFLWPSGYQKLAASTMATLFWAGDALAPKLRCRRPRLDGSNGIEEVSVQDLLQDAFIEAFGHLADRLSDLEACVGFNCINEPHRGLINLHQFHGWNYDTDLHIGHCPTLAQSLALGSGHAQRVDYYVRSWPWPTRISHKSLLDPKGRTAWLTDGEHGMGECVWKAHGVWDWDDKKKAAKILDDDYFEVDHRPGREGQKIEWYRDFYAPFLNKFSRRMNRKLPRFTLVEPIPNEFMPPWPESDTEDVQKFLKQKYAEKTVITTERPRDLVFAPHFYDLNVLFTKHHAWMSVNVQGLSRGMFPLRCLYFGVKGQIENYKVQIGNIVKYGRKSLGSNIPVVIGEIGIPFDMNNREAYLTGCYDKQRECMNALISAMEYTFVNYTLWNYNPANRVEYGDGWNKEDFSICNGDTIVDHRPIRPDYRNRDHENDKLYKGGRVLDVIIRPYAVKSAGVPLRSGFDYQTLRYEYEWKSGSNNVSEKSNLTEVYIPMYHYGEHDVQITLSDGEWTLNKDRQTLYIRHESVGSHKVVVEIPNAREHRLERLRVKRHLYPPGFPKSFVSVETEALLEDVEWSWIITILLALLPILVIILVVGIYFG